MRVADKKLYKKAPFPYDGSDPTPKNYAIEKFGF